LLISIEADLENAVYTILVVRLIQLISQHKVKNFLDHTQARVENNVAELRTTKYALLHVFQ